MESFTPEGQSYSYTVCGYSAARTASSSSEAVSSAQSKACTCTCTAHGYSFKTDLIYRCFLNWIETHSWTSQFGNGKCWTRCTINQKEKKKIKTFIRFLPFFFFFFFKIQTHLTYMVDNSRNLETSPEMQGMCIGVKSTSGSVTLGLFLTFLFSFWLSSLFQRAGMFSFF